MFVIGWGEMFMLNQDQYKVVAENLVAKVDAVAKNVSQITLDKLKELRKQITSYMKGLKKFKPNSHTYCRQILLKANIELKRLIRNFGSLRTA